MSAHTPGPWTADPITGEVRAENDSVAMVLLCREGLENLHLIAAAPDLLALLKAMIEPFAYASDDKLREYPDSPRPRNILAARAAIAKATAP